MRSLLIFVLFFLAGTLLHTEANPTLEDAVGYLLALADHSNQNGYAIAPRSSQVQQFNRHYESVDASGITGQHDRSRLMEACRGVIVNIKFFEAGSSLGGILTERYGPTQALAVIRILGRPNEQVTSRNKAGEVVFALFTMDKVCQDLLLHSNAHFSNPTLRDVIEYLLAFHGSRQIVDLAYTPGPLAEACQAVTDNMQHFNKDSAFGQIMLEKFFKIDKVCLMLSLNSNVQSSNPTLSDVFGYLLAYHPARQPVCKPYGLTKISKSGLAI